MLVKDLQVFLQNIVTVHPEAANAQVWADTSEAGYKFQVKNIQYRTRKGQPIKVVLED